MATSGERTRLEYEQRMAEIRRGFEMTGDGLSAAAARSGLLDGMLHELWQQQLAVVPALARGVAVVAVGGYGRGQLFPYSDVDLLFCVERGAADRAKEPIRKLSQTLWDCGLRASPVTRTVAECERFALENSELGLSLLDRRFVSGDPGLFEKLDGRIVTKLIGKDAKAIRAELLVLTRQRHARYGNTLFHLEPNVKDCPGGLRDANVTGWLRMLAGENPASPPAPGDEFAASFAFLAAVRCFLHYRHERDDNTLDWQAQDGAAEQSIGLPRVPAQAEIAASSAPDAAAWMRSYFRHARVIDRTVQRVFEQNQLPLLQEVRPKRIRLMPDAGFRMQGNCITLKEPAGGHDPAAEPDPVLGAFTAVARTGARLDSLSEERIAGALPLLSANLEEGPALWAHLEAILTGEHAGAALRAMHAIGVLELILPEFHGIDALVIRDAYHRYTVDEHTFVLIDTLHALEAEPMRGSPEWRIKFGALVGELQSPGLLYLGALLHDTGKGRMGPEHAVESARIAQAVLQRLEMDPYDMALVLRLIETHLEMSAALRRDIFDAGTVRSFAAKVQTHESLRMLTLLTYADIQAVHPDALTPWKAENLWRLSMRAANQLDRNVDEERVHVSAPDEGVASVLALLRGREAEARRFLEGFPERYLRTRSKEAIVQHFEMSAHFAAEPLQIAFHHAPAISEIMLVTRDRPRLFSSIAGALAAWGMNVVTADAFANAEGIVVDSFRFTDTFRTLELNSSERERFVGSMRALVSGEASIEAMLSGRRSRRRRVVKVPVETRIEFDVTASTHSTLLQVVTQDLPGVLRAISETLSSLRYNVEVALVDTEGETAIDVFYLTRDSKKLEEAQQAELRDSLREALEANAGQ